MGQTNPTGDGTTPCDLLRSFPDDGHDKEFDDMYDDSDGSWAIWFPGRYALRIARESGPYQITLKSPDFINVQEDAVVAYAERENYHDARDVVETFRYNMDDLYEMARKTGDTIIFGRV